MTNIKNVDILKKMVDDYRLLSLDDLKIDNIDELMKNRDDDIFAVPWGDRYDEIKKYRNDPPGQVRYRIPIKERKIIESIMEEIYFRVYDSCEDEDLLVYYDDLSAYLSDDFGLIAESLYWGYNNGWVNALFYEYTKHRIPSGCLKEIKGDLSEILMDYYVKCNKM